MHYGVALASNVNKFYFPFLFFVIVFVSRSRKYSRLHCLLDMWLSVSASLAGRAGEEKNINIVRRCVVW
jgi:hypothetical protein